MIFALTYRGDLLPLCTKIVTEVDPRLPVTFLRITDFELDGYGVEFNFNSKVFEDRSLGFGHLGFGQMRTSSAPGNGGEQR